MMSANGYYCTMSLFTPTRAPKSRCVRYASRVYLPYSTPGRAHVSEYQMLPKADTAYQARKRWKVFWGKAIRT